MDQLGIELRIFCHCLSLDVIWTDMFTTTQLTRTRNKGKRYHKTSYSRVPARLSETQRDPASPGEIQRDPARSSKPQ